jgi:phosphoglycolate phosphatase-like HAD superfamily hydrolase
LPLMEKVELEQAGQARLRWGVKEGLDSLEATKLKLALITDLSKSAAEKIIEEQSLKKYFTALAARSKEGLHRDLKQQVDTILKESGLKVGNVLLVTGSPATVREAKAAGIRVVALPLEGINVKALVDAKPDALLLNLQELRDMLALEGLPFSGE